MQGEGQDHHRVPSKGEDQCGCLSRLWYGLTKGLLRELESYSISSSWQKQFNVAQRHLDL